MKKMIVLFFLLWSDASLWAQPQGGKMLVSNYSTKDYRAQPQNWAIVQDPRGIIYVGNSDGLLEYDGANWRLIELPNESSVRSLAMNKQGRLYIGAVGEIGYLAPDKRGEMRYVSLLGQLPEAYRKFGEVWKTHTCNDEVYFQPRHFLIRIKKGKVKIWQPKDAYLRSFMVEEKIYVYHRGQGLYCLDADSLRPVKEGKKFATDEIYAMQAFDKDHLLIGTRTAGLFLYHKSREEVRPFPVSCQEWLQKNPLYTMLRISHDRWALGLVRGGVIFVNQQGKQVDKLDLSTGLQDNNANAFFVDRQQGLWVALERGLARADVGSALRFWDTELGLQSTIFSCIRYKNVMYVGTAEGLFFLCPNKQRFERIEAVGDQCWALQIVDDELLAVTTRGLFSVKDDQVHLIDEGRHTCLQMDKSGKKQLLITGGGGSLLLLAYKNGRWEREFTSPVLITAGPSGMVADKQNHIWISTRYEGLLRIDKTFWQTRQIKARYYGKAQGLPSVNNNHVFFIRQQLMVSTKNGVYYYDSQGDRFLPAPDMAVLRDRVVFTMAEDKRGNIWFDSNKGHGFLMPHPQEGYQLVEKPFRRVQPSNGDSRPVYCEDSLVWFANDDALFCYNYYKGQHRDSSHTFATLIRGVIDKHDSLIFGGNDAHAFLPPLLAASMQRQVKPSEFPYQCNSLLFHYAAPGFDNESANEYSYFLQGYDRDWSAWTTETKKEYTNLHEGQYLFRVKSKNIYNDIGSEARYAFVIHPPWYRSWGAYLCYSLLAVLLLLGAIHLNARRLQHENERLEKIIQQRTQEILARKEEILMQSHSLQEANLAISRQNEQIHQSYLKLKELERFKEAMLGMVVHDLKNPLNNVIGFARSQPENPLMERIEQCGKVMLNMVMNMLDIQRFEEAMLRPVLAPENISEVVQAALDQVALLLQEKQLQLSRRINSTWLVNIDRELIVRVMVNLLTNAIKYTPLGGNIVLEACSQDTQLKISISDTGEGIPADKLDTIFDKFSQIKARNSGQVRSTGLGLTFCKMAIEAHGGYIGVRSSLGIGTVFFFTLPLLAETAQQAAPPPVPAGQLQELLESDRLLLQEFSARIRQLQVYDSSEWYDILLRIRETGSPALLQWADEMENAVFGMDEKRYGQLLSRF